MTRAKEKIEKAKKSLEEKRSTMSEEEIKAKQAAIARAEEKLLELGKKVKSGKKAIKNE